mmetsp:Transcript_159420/g.511499  ORF Transcript_159420/g.511499 Transcript_159420/m.511499 type:complete len:232 (-) Transcript_159420:71-766(-)
MLLVDLDRFLLPAVQGALVGPHKYSTNTSDNPDLPGDLILDFDVLVDLQVQGAEFFVVEQHVIGARENDLLTSVDRDFARHLVLQPDVFEGLQHPGLLNAALGFHGRVQEQQRLALLHHPLAGGLVLQADVLVLLQRNGGRGGRGALVGLAGEPHSGALGDRLVSCELVLHEDVIRLAQSNPLAVKRSRLLRPQVQQLRPSLDTLLAGDRVFDDNVVQLTKGLGLYFCSRT